MNDQGHEQDSEKRRKEKECLDTKVRRCVKKCIRDNLNTMTEQELHNIVVDGMSCFQKLMQDTTIAFT